MAKSETKKSVEILLVRAELTGVPEKRLPVSRNLGTVELIWPKAGAAKKSASREMVFHRGRADFTAEPWAKRILFRDEIDALATMVGESSAPKSIAQGVVDYDDLPAEGEVKTVVLPLKRPITGRDIGTLVLEVRG